MSRVHSLDGYRGIAVLLVGAAHLFHGVAPQDRPFASWTQTWFNGGGLVGVQMFFVLSGYLITGILLRELESRGRVDVLRFWARRMRRLYPALIAVCIAYAAYALLVHMARNTSLGTVTMVTGAPTLDEARQQLLNALTYTTNFGAFGPWGWLGHTWSLAVEEQFYLFWPLALLAGWLIARRTGIVIIAAVGIVATVASRDASSMSADEVDMLLRWDALLLGCTLAVASRKPFVFPGQALLGAAGFVVLAYCSLWPAELQSDKYLVTTVAAGAALLGAPRFRLLESGILCYFGRVSYSLYLWHVLLLRFALPGPISLLVILIAAELSYRYVERRFWTPHDESEVESVTMRSSRRR